MCEHCKFRHVQVHLFDTKGRATLISYGERATIADITNALGARRGSLEIMVVRPLISFEGQTNPEKPHRVYYSDQFSGSAAVMIEELL